MADTDRELALRITADAAQAKAELDSLKTSTDTVTAATGEQAAALSTIQAASQNAGNALSELTQITAAGGKISIEAYRNAEVAVEGLRGSITAARDAGFAVPQEAIDNVEKYGFQLYQARFAIDDASEAATRLERVQKDLAPAVSEAADAHVRAYTEAGKLASAQAAVAQAAGLSVAQLKSLGEGAGLSASQLASLGEQTGFTATQAAVLTQGERSLEVALAGEAGASRVAAVAADAHVVAFRAQQAVMTPVILGLKEAQAAFAALATAGTVGSAGFTAAIGRAAIAVAGLEAEIRLAQASGGIVTPAQIAGLEAYRLRLSQTMVSLGATSTATAGLAGSSRLLTTATTQAANAMLGKTVQVGALGGGLLRLVSGPIGIFITAVTLLPSLIKIVVDSAKSWGASIGETIAGLNQQDGVLRKAGESTNDYQKRVNETADKQFLWERALDASRKGLIDWSNDVDVARARYIVYMDSLGKGNFTLKQVEDAYKQLGLTVAKVLTFEEAAAGVRTFMQGYQKALSEGENATRRYVEANKGKVEEYMESFEDLGREIPKDLKAVADSYDIVTTKQKEATQVAKDHAEAMKLLTPAAKAAVEASESLLAAGIASGKAFQTATVNVEGLLKSIQKIDLLAPAFVTQSGTIVRGLDAIAAAAAAADGATNSLFALPGVPSKSELPGELFEPELEFESGIG